MLIHIDSTFKCTQKNHKLSISHAYSFHTYMTVSYKLKTIRMLNLNFELKSQKHNSHVAFSYTILIRINSALYSAKP